MIRTIWGDPERYQKSYYPDDFKGKLYLAGDGASEAGDRPFLDRFSLSTRKKERLFRCEEGRFESFLAFLGTSLTVAFWVDAVTYLASAALILTMVIPAVVRTVAEAVPGLRGFVADLMAGWRFLRNEPVLRANTLQAVVAQFSIGVSPIVNCPCGPTASRT